MTDSASLKGAALAMCAATLAFSACRKSDFPVYPSNYREYAYVANNGSNTVTIIDLVNLREDREIATGERPSAVMASKARNEAYVVNEGNGSGNGSLSVIDALQNQTIATIALRRAPVAMELDDEAGLAYIANSGANSVSVVDLKLRREKAVIGVGEKPVALKRTPDGKSLLVANSDGNSISIFDTAGLNTASKPRAVFDHCPGAGSLAILPDSSKAFVACAAGHQVLSIRLANGKQPDRVEALMDVGKLPCYLAIKPDGGEIFVMNSGSDTISELSTPTNDVGGSYLMGAHPGQGLVSEDNSLLYVSNSGSNEVTIYAVDDGERVGGVSVGDGPSAMAFSAAGNLLLVADSRSADVALVRTASRALFNIIPTGKDPVAIAVASFNVK